jgi:signal transduction histidine kinase
MEEIAVKLAGGAYGIETGVKQRDEIGRLASAIDQLSEKLRLAEGERERLNQLRQAFIANISHELRTPVTVLRGSLEALCDRVVSEPAQVAEYHRQMLDETIALERLVNDLMDLTRLENTDFPLESRKLSLGDALDDAVRSARGLARAKRIEITVERGDPVAIEGDYGRLRQMFLIVLDNAVKYSSEDSAVEVFLETDRVRIRDHGLGIPQEDLPYLFDRFFRASSVKDSAGSGLGLAIARRIAERHGIRIEVSSQFGEGAEFRFLLPEKHAALSKPE